MAFSAVRASSSLLTNLPQRLAAASGLPTRLHGWLQALQRAEPAAAAAATAAAAASQGRRWLGSSAASAAAARDGIEGDIISPDVGLARIDGWVGCTAADAGTRAALCRQLRRALLAVLKTQLVRGLQGRRGGLQREQRGGGWRHHAVRCRVAAGLAQVKEKAGGPGARLEPQLGWPTSLPRSLTSCRRCVHAVAGPALVRRDAGQPGAAAPAAPNPRWVPGRTRMVDAAAQGGTVLC